MLLQSLKCVLFFLISYLSFINRAEVLSTSAPLIQSMKKLFLLGLVVALFNSCEDCPSDRFTTNSPQIDIAKQIHKYYLAGDWDAMTKHYTDSAKIHYNTWEPSTVAESQIMLQQLLLVLILDYVLTLLVLFYRKV